MNDNETTFILAGNGPYENRGCEAIVRGTTKIIRKFFHNPKFICISHFDNIQQFKNQKNNEFDSEITHKYGILRNDVLMTSYRRILSNFSHLLYGKSIYHNIINDFDRTKAVLSIGGDNYSLKPGSNLPLNYTSLDLFIKKNNLPIFIWGASIGPFSNHLPTEHYMSHHLKEIDGIFTRESGSTKYLSQIGVKKNVFQVSDPAFVMDAIPPSGYKADDISKDAIGLNFSNIMSKYVTNGDIFRWEKIVIDVINKISEEFGCEIFLIPHVTVLGGNDYQFLKNVYDNLPKNRNITLISQDLNAQETKWIISKMKIFGGARTHSTIAALSSYVPTVSFAYSIKALGINSDIFGNLRYCITPKENYSNNVILKIQEVFENSYNIKNELQEKIPIIQDNAMNAGKLLFDSLHNIDN